MEEQLRIQNYETFVTDPNIIDLRREIAHIRTLAYEFRASLEAGSLQQREAFFSAFKKTIEGTYEDLQVEDLMESLALSYDFVFAPTLRMSAKEAEAMVKIHKTAADVVEKYKKVTESTAVKLEWSSKLENALTQFALVVIPYVAEELRPQLKADLAQRFLPSLRSSI